MKSNLKVFAELRVVVEGDAEVAGGVREADLATLELHARALRAHVQARATVAVSERQLVARLAS